MRASTWVGLGVAIAVTACGGSDNVSFPIDGASPPTTTSSVDAGAPTDPSTTDAGSDPAASPDATVAPPAAADAGAPFVDASSGIPAPPLPPSPPPTSDAGDVLGGLTGITASCTVASTGTYETDRSTTAAVNVCKLKGAFFWKADLAVDCDGQQTTECNSTTDATFSAETSATQSNGQPLIASQLPYVVIPLPSTRFDYTKQDIKPGALAIVIYGSQVVYGVFGDEGPTNVIGEASYAMASAFGMSTSPNTGGTAGTVTYIVLTGAAAVVSPIENHGSAVTLAGALVPQLIANN